ncbi:MAG TPA: two-component regulator propeller domain-containing protein, partial [Draconibacterium sp.]|nr:two-component regulator propeller domain-containing protein [Draconibacterium sp.]
ISAIAANCLNNRWFGTYDSGIWNFDGTDWTNYSESNSNLAYNSVVYNSMALDSKNNLWVGTLKSTMGTGVTMYDRSQWHVFNSDSGLVYNNVVNIAIDDQGEKWFVTTKGISSFDDSIWVSYTSENTGIDIIDYVFSVAIDRENNKWFGSYRGALKFDGTTWTAYNTSNSGLKWNLINAIAVDNDNNIWFATESGVSKFDGTNWVNYTSVKDGEYKVVNCRAIAIDSKNNKWIATTYGLIKLED